MQGSDVILGLLNERDLTGYDIKKKIDGELKFFFDGTSGMIYPTLKKLEAQGKVTKRTIPQEGLPTKNVYCITAKGRKDVMDYLTSPVDDEVLKSDFLMRMYFADKWLEPEQIRALIEDEIARKRANLTLLQKNLRYWEEEGMDPLQKVAYNYGIAYYSAVITALSEALKAAEAGTLAESSRAVMGILGDALKG